VIHEVKITALAHEVGVSTLVRGRLRVAKGRTDVVETEIVLADPSDAILATPWVVHAGLAEVCSARGLRLTQVDDALRADTIVIVSVSDGADDWLY